MSSINRNFNPKIGPIVQIGIAKPNSFEPSAPPHPNLVVTNALLDTGAARTCVTAEIADKAGLRVLGRTPISSVHGIKDANVYYADIMLLTGDPINASSGTRNVHGHLATKVQIVEFLANSQHFRAIIGRDLLCLCDFQMTRDHEFTLTPYYESN